MHQREQCLFTGLTAAQLGSTPQPGPGRALVATLGFLCRNTAMAI
jgi:hypothetical protein